jgi:hypothetical protein
VKILRGGSAETASGKWVKFDIELDEGDIQSEVMKYNLAGPTLTVIQKYTLLVKLAELLVTVRMEELGATGDTAVTKLNQSYKDYVASLPRAED